MIIKGAIFDLDGTILNSMPVWETAGERYLLSKEIDPGYDIQKDLKTKSLYQAAVFMKEKYEITDSVEKIMDDINKVIEKSYFEDVLPKEGVRDFLEFLRENDVKMCIATATDRYMVEAALKRCKLDIFFEKIFTCSEVGKGKDEPDIFNFALEFLNTEKERTWIFEDAFYASQTAKNAGFKVCGVFDNSEFNIDKLKLTADVFVLNLSDAIEYFK